MSDNLPRVNTRVILSFFSQVPVEHDLQNKLLSSSEDYTLRVLIFVGMVP